MVCAEQAIQAAHINTSEDDGVDDQDEFKDDDQEGSDRDTIHTSRQASSEIHQHGHRQCAHAPLRICSICTVLGLSSCLHAHVVETGHTDS